MLQFGLWTIKYILIILVFSFTNAYPDNEIKFQLVLPHVHRANIAEHAIQTFKSHFKEILAMATTF